MQCARVHSSLEAVNGWSDPGPVQNSGCSDLVSIQEETIQYELHLAAFVPAAVDNGGL